MSKQASDPIAPWFVAAEELGEYKLLLMLGHAPVIKDGGPVVFTCEARITMAGFPAFLTEIDHYRSRRKGG